MAYRLLQLIAAIVAVLTLAISLLAWRIASGPLALDWLTPYVADALSDDDGLRTEIGGTRLRLSDDIELVELVASDVRATGEDGTLIAEFPEVEIGLSVAALLRGMVAVTSLDAVAPHLVLLRRENGSIGLRGGAASGGGRVEIEPLLGQFLDNPDSSGPASYFEHLHIAGGRLTLIDEVTDQQIEALDADMMLLRNPDGFGGNVSFDVVQAGAPAKVRLSARYQAADGWIRFALDVDQLVPAELAGLAPGLPLAGIDIPLGLRLLGGARPDGAWAPVGFELSAGPGEVDLPELLVAPLAIDAVRASGELASGFQDVVLRDIEVTAMGAALSGQAELSWHDGALSGTVEVSARDVAVEHLDLWWPPEAGDAARAWVIPHITAGIVPQARATISIQPGDLAQRPVREGMVEGSFDFQDLTVRYFEDLPPLTDVAGSATFTARRMDFAIERGRVGDLAASDGSVVITGIGIPGREATQLEIRTQVIGRVRDVLALIDHPPLGFAGKADLSPADASGMSRTDLRIGMPLHREVTEEEVWVKASSVLSDAGLVTPSFTLSDADMDLTVDNDGFDLVGQAQVDGIPLQLEVRDNFADDAPFSTRYRVRGPVQAEAITRLVGGEMPLVLTGAVGLDATITESPGLRAAEVALDLDPLAIESPLLDWRKAAGESGSLAAALVMPDGAGIEIRSFALATPTLEAQGSVRLRTEPVALRSITLDRLRFGATEGVLSVSRGIDQGYDITLTAGTLDLGPVIEAAERHVDSYGADPEGPPEPLRLTLRADRVLLGDHTLRTVQADLARDGEGWRSAFIRAQLPKGSILNVTLSPDGDHRRLQVINEDAASLLKAVRETSPIEGGALDLDARVYRQYPTYDVEGTLRISDFTLVEAPILARLLTVASLTGISNLLAGEGIYFDRFDLPFRYREDTLFVDRALLSGSQLGLTAKGTMDLARDELDLSGTIVPVYGLNWAIGRIPILGDFLRGSEGEGAFALTYSVSGDPDDPSILVNPLSVLTPGVVRELFSGIFEGAAEQPAVRTAPN